MIPTERDTGSHNFSHPTLNNMESFSNRKRVRGDASGPSDEENKSQCLSEPTATTVFVPEAQAAIVSQQSGVADFSSERKRQKILSEQPSTAFEMCQNCGGKFKRILMHLKFNKSCSEKYGAAKITEIRQKNAAESKQKKYDNFKKNTFDAQKKMEKTEKQRVYDNLHKEKILEKQRKYDKAHRNDKIEKQRLYDKVHKAKIMDKQNAAYEKNKQQIQLKRLINRVITSTDMTEQERLKKFLNATKYGPIFACICCHRMMFINQVVQVNIAALKTSCNAKSDQLFERSIAVPIEDKFKVLNHHYLCENCNLYLTKKGKIPPMSALNGLLLDPVPPVLQLSDIEATLISQNILFLKIFELPTSRWKASSSKIVNVPIGDDQIKQTMNSLPRSPSEAGVIPIRFKRKLEYKGFIHDSFVDVKKLEDALKMLKQLQNPYYEFVEINQNYLQMVEENENFVQGEDLNEFPTSAHEMDKSTESDEFLIAKLTPPPIDHEMDKSTDSNEFFNVEETPQMVFDEMDTTEFSVVDQTTSPVYGIDKSHEDITKTTNDEEEIEKQHEIEDEEDFDDIVFRTEDVNTPNDSHEEKIEEQNEIIDEEDLDDIIYRTKDVIRKFQFDLGTESVLTHQFPETTVTSPNTQSGTASFEIAPGEGKVPTNIMRENDWDVKAFPTLYPTGKYGLHHSREISLSMQKYFQQRLFNIDTRFSSNPAYLFSAVYVIERQQLERSKNISFQRGKITTDGQKRTLSAMQDAFSVFEKIKGTPKYWQQARYEMLAKLEQHGPFQFFFTLSCADKRWMENIITMLHQDGHHVSYKTNKDPNKLVIQNDEIFIDDIPVDEFLAQTNLHELAKKNVLNITRIFDHRVQMFIRHIMTGKANPMNVKFYNYRVEFQMRGAAHIHGVIWVDFDALEGSFPGLKLAFTKFCEEKELSDEETAVTVAFIDKFITCSRQNKEVSNIVEEVQIHHHTKACRKYGTICRFSYPKYPSKRTIIARPLPNNLSPEERLKLQQSHKKILDTVKSLLKELKEDELENTTLEQLLDKANVSLQEYEAALSTSQTGIHVVLKRRVNEIFVNNYNAEWLKAWNGNIDIQICLDFFAIITYITDYYTKDESGTTEHLKMVAKECKEQAPKEQMTTLINAFQSHRQMGESEAYYRIIPHLHLKGSNTGCIFVSTGFPRNRNRFLMKVADDDKEEEEEDEIANTQKIEVEGHDGKYVEKPSIHIKYENRPGCLKNVCFAQFVIMYVTCSSREAKGKAFQNGVYGKTEHRIITWKTFDDTEKTLNCLPYLIQIGGPNMTYMKCRSNPLVLRTHKFKGDANIHEFFYSQLMLYKPWRSENELAENDFEKCLELFNEIDTLEREKPENEQVTKIEKTMLTLFPNIKSVEEGRTKVAEAKSERALHIGDEIDPALEQTEGDDNEIAMKLPEEFSHRDPLGYDEEDNNYHTSKEKVLFKRLDVSNHNEMLCSVRKLVPEQRIAFDKVIQFCKNLKKSLDGKNRAPIPPLLMIHGGAGSGKSTIIHEIAKWAEYTLRKSGDNPDQPYVIKLAPTGMAASNINGATIHSAFSFVFSNEFTSLSDKKRKTHRELYNNLKILIIDEISMVKADMLYQINLRLMELKQNDMIFGGVAVILFGDLLQLRPIQGRYIFEAPKCSEYQVHHDFDSLWSHFDFIELKENHRQGSDKQYAEILNRIRYETFTNEDMKLLRSRICSEENLPKNAVYIYGDNVNVTKCNTKLLDELSSEEVIIPAINTHPMDKNYTPPIGPHGRIANSPFMDELKLKIGARIMLVYNIDTSDCLTNGTRGTVHSWNMNESGKVMVIFVDFDNEDAGKDLRAKTKLEHTPIYRQEFDYSVSKRQRSESKATVYQFPLQLSFATTSHKYQGQTVKKPTCLIADMSTVFQASQAYVILGRVQELNQIFFTNFPEKDKRNRPIIRADPSALKEAERISNVALNRNLGVWHTTVTDTLRICFINVRSMHKHYEDLKADSVILKSDILFTCETWLHENTNLANFLLPTFETPPKSVGYGHGKGMACYYNNCEQIGEMIFLQNESESCHIIQAHVLSLSLSIYGIYRSQNFPVSSVIEKLSFLFEREAGCKNVIVIGDINQSYTNNNLGSFRHSLENKGFEQIVTEGTHLEGNIIDHCYIKLDNMIIKDKFLHPVYFSDHDAICIALGKNEL